MKAVPHFPWIIFKYEEIKPDFRCLGTHPHDQSTSKYPHGGLNSQHEAQFLRLLKLVRPLYRQWLVTMGASGHRQVGNQRALHCIWSSWKAPGTS